MSQVYIPDHFFPPAFFLTPRSFFVRFLRSFVDETETSGLAASELGLQAENEHNVTVLDLVHLAELLLELFLRYICATRVEHIHNLQNNSFLLISNSDNILYPTNYANSSIHSLLNSIYPQTHELSPGQQPIGDELASPDGAALLRHGE